MNWTWNWHKHHCDHFISSNWWIERGAMVVSGNNDFGNDYLDKKFDVDLIRWKVSHKVVMSDRISIFSIPCETNLATLANGWMKTNISVNLCYLSRIDWFISIYTPLAESQLLLVTSCRKYFNTSFEIPSKKELQCCETLWNEIQTLSGRGITYTIVRGHEFSIHSVIELKDHWCADGIAIIWETYHR